jgi:hypothetical protein
MNPTNVPSINPTAKCHDSSNVNDLGVSCENYLAMFNVGADVICRISLGYAEQCCKLCTEYLSPSRSPSPPPTFQPTRFPSLMPSRLPTYVPTKMPSRVPTSTPTIFPSLIPTKYPTNSPSCGTYCCENKETKANVS